MKTFTGYFSRILVVAAITLVSRSLIALEICSDAAVSRGQVMSGFQATGVTESHYLRALPGDYYIGAMGPDSRGFINPQNPSPSSQCENDYILMGQWFGVGMHSRNPKHAEELLSGAPHGSIVELYMEIDGKVLDRQQTSTRVEVIKPFGHVMLNMFGQVFEPFYFAPGIHTANIVFQIDLDCMNAGCDGIADYNQNYSSIFEVIDSDAPAP